MKASSKSLRFSHFPFFLLSGARIPPLILRFGQWFQKGMNIKYLAATYEPASFSIPTLTHKPDPFPNMVTLQLRSLSLSPALIFLTPTKTLEET